MPAPKKPETAFYLQTEHEYGTVQMVAHAAWIDPAGELLNPSFGYGKPHQELADLRIRAYFPDVGSGERLYGTRHEFQPFSVDLAQAESMVKVLRKVGKGLERINSDEGWLSDGDFAGYVVRVARVLGIGAYYVPNTKKAAEVSGQKFRRTDGAGLQMWVGDRLLDRGSAEVN